MTEPDPAEVLRGRRHVAYAAWQKASARLDRDTTIANSRAEESAWEVYTDACDLLGECIEPGCHTVTPEHVYCPAHRPK